MENLSNYPGINVLVLGKVHVCVNSHFKYYQYNLTDIISERTKIMLHKVNINNYVNENINYVKELKTYINIPEFNCARLNDKIKIIDTHRNKRGIINGLGTIIKTVAGNLDSYDNQRYIIKDYLKKLIKILKLCKRKI